MSEAKVKIYTSGVAGNVFVNKNQTRIEFILSAKKIDFQLIDLSLDSNTVDKEYTKKKSFGKKLPLIYSWDNTLNSFEYRGGIEELEEANENGLAEVKKFLELDE
ncbi:hypothetical protein HDU92_003856 [Lobulomyces angularis]|nr:hypothetical protein HDU92_003856 [Lobulomyces angularis]